MNGRRQSLTAPSGGGGGGGGGSRRILAATITYSGAPASFPSDIVCTVTGTLPDPALVLPGGVLQSIEFVSRSLLDTTISTTVYDPGVNFSVLLPFVFKFGCGGAGVSDATWNIRSLYVSSAPGATIGRNFNSTDRVMITSVTFDASPISSWGFTPTVSMTCGGMIASQPYSSAGGGPTVVSVTYTALQLDGSIKVYYLFD